MRQYASPYLALLIFLFVACSAVGGGERNSNLGGSGSSNGGTNGSGATGVVTGSGGQIIIPMEYDNPCDAEDAPEDCNLEPSGPACGDGNLDVEEGEACDDGNSLPGDGCNGVCAIENYFECPTPGQPCVSTIVCGDGVIGPGEACDDGNATSGDGCNDGCNTVEVGFRCREAGQPCIEVFVCGDGRVDANEGCDDGNNDEGDGCSPRCKLEIGFKCDGNPSVCTPTTCGDSIVEGSESCDDGNDVPFDGCSGICQAEPDCSGGACVSACGDGIVLDEDCDDGNLRNGDGCDDKCQVEEGFECSSEELCPDPDEECTLVVPAVFRDFNQSHSDFEPGFLAPEEGFPGLVEDQLDAEGKPVLASAQNDGNIASLASFAEWYRDTSAVNSTIVSQIVLWPNGMDGFVNRWGPNGEQWLGPVMGNGRWCGNAADWADCAEASANNQCNQPAFDPAVDTCWEIGATVPADAPPNCCTNCFCAGTIMQEAYDGNPLFFPIDNDPNALTPPAQYSEAKIPEQYGYVGWPWETDYFPDAPLHNFHFTSEVKYWFQYNADQTVQLDFSGDDDVWVFVNGHLALDLGGWHVPLDGTVTVNAQTANTYGLSDGNVYEIKIFHAERQTEGSTFKLTLSGFTLAPSDCVTDCGDGEVGAGEECDFGAGMNNGEYNGCTSDCRWGPFCGDQIIQTDVEVCDDGVNDGSYGGCAPGCQLGPRCGDAVVQSDHEQCDDGTNAGGYGECAPGCVLGPYCGDGVENTSFEECDDGNNEDDDGCSAACVLEVVVE